MAADSFYDFGGPKGYWLSKQLRVVGYLGLRFQVHGKTHYGWARLRVVSNFPDERLDATLLGYAYETVPNKAIIAGKTRGADTITLPMETKAGTLGYLALGKK
jgi:hypothetical protein